MLLFEELSLVLSLILAVIPVLTAARARRLTVTAAWLAALASAATLVAVAIRGKATVGFGGPPWTSWVGFDASALTASVETLILGVGALVQSFSVRYLQTDPLASLFASRAAAVIALMAAVATADSLFGLVLAWVGAGMAFVSVLGYRRDLPGTRSCARSAWRSFAVGDACLVAALVIAAVVVGPVHLGSARALGTDLRRLGAWDDAVSALVAVAALSRCAQGVFHRWLSLSVSAPTPACVLLHAGVVNGGGLLLLRLDPLGTWKPAMATLLVIAGLTSVWSGAVMSSQADVKGSLASSTRAQMGFMLAECAVGAYPAAVVHLIGHAMYKGHQFMASGSTVSKPGQLHLTSAQSRPRRRLLAAAVGLAAAGASTPGVHSGDGWVIVFFAATSAVAISLSWASHFPASLRSQWRWPLGLVVASGLYGATADLVGRFAGRDLTFGGALSPWWLLVFAAAAWTFPRLVHSGRLPMLGVGTLVEAAPAVLS